MTRNKIRTEAFTPHTGSAVDPLVEERSSIAWRMTGADPTHVDEALVRNIKSRFDLAAEVSWSPGRSALVAEIRKCSTTSDIEARIGLSILGATASTAIEAESLAKQVESTVNRPPYAAVRFDPDLMDDWAEEGGGGGALLHAAHIRQRRWRSGARDLGDTVEVVSRFLPTLEPWGSVARTVASADQELRVRMTALATELSPHDRLEIECNLDRIARLRDATSHSDLKFDLDRAEGTLLDVRASMATPCFIFELAVFSPDELPEMALRSIASAFTSEGDVWRRNGSTAVASQRMIVGGFDIEREPPRWKEAVRTGLPLHGGVLPSDLSHKNSLFENMWSWPVPTGKGIPGVPVTLPAKRELSEVVPDDVDATVLGNAVDGSPVRMPIELRFRHTFVSGTWGAGKSTAMFTMALDDLVNGRPFTFIDPHGTTAALLAGWGRHLGTDMVVVDCTNGGTDRLRLFDRLRPTQASAERFEIQSNRLLDAITSSLPDPEWTGPVFRRTFPALLAITAAHGGELVDLANWSGNQSALRMLVRHPDVPDWARDTILPLTRDNDGAKHLQWASSKVNMLMSSNVRRIVGAAGKGTDVSAAVDGNRTIIISGIGLSKSEFRFITHANLETELATKLEGATSAQATMDDVRTIYVDEAHLLYVQSMSQIVVEGRKSATSLVLTTQTVTQLPRELRDLVAAAETKLIFRATPDTASFLEEATDLSRRELTRLPDLHCIYAVRNKRPVSVMLEPMVPPPSPFPLKPPRRLKPPVSARQERGPLARLGGLAE